MEIENELLLAQIAALIGDDVRETQISVMAISLSERVDIEELKKAVPIYIQKYLYNRPVGERFAVTLAKIINIARPNETKEDEAQLAAAAIIKSIRAFGYTNPLDAQKFMGALAWQTVESLGGWTLICQETSIRDERIFLAQLRDIAKSIFQKGLNNTQQKEVSKLSTNLTNLLNDKPLASIDK